MNEHPKDFSGGFRYLSTVSVLLLTALVSATPPCARAAQLDIDGPVGSGQFGATATVLPNGNFVVTDPYYDAPGPIVDVGAVYLYDGGTLAVISTLIGSQTDDKVGSGGITVLNNGNYVVTSPSWDNGAAANAGAVTWCSGAFGATGAVSAANSLVGSQTDDYVGGVTALSNGNYVVLIPQWDSGAAIDAGAVTWGNGMTGVSGPVSAANSLVGSQPDDRVGNYGVTVLSNGNYVVLIPQWDSGAAIDAGAVTWGNGMTGVSGPVSAANSLVGSTASDYVGLDGVTELNNGNYVVGSKYWDNDAVVNAGAVTWGNGLTGVSGPVSAANSLVGSSAYDYVGTYGVTALNNGNYVVISMTWDKDAVVDAGAVTWGNGLTGVSGPVSAANSLVGSKRFDFKDNSVAALNNGNYVVLNPHWDKDAVVDAGAVTWGNGLTGVSGPVSAGNSLVGSNAYDYVGNSVAVLNNGNYVVLSLNWDNGVVVDAGAVTWGNGTSGVSGAVSAGNSLVGSSAGDAVGSEVSTLNNGNYVVSSPYWFKNAGAVTWGNGTTGVSGPVSAANSLVGSSAYDYVGNGGVTALNNGNYVVVSTRHNSAAINAGAVTWGSGTSGVSGAVSAANSLVGSTASDYVGLHGVTVLNNGNYVVRSPYWDSDVATDAGAVTWGSGTFGATGAVSAANSLVGSQTGDLVGYYGVTVLKNGNYVVMIPNWDNGAVVDAGAVTWGNGTTGATGPVSAGNSLVGSVPGDQVGDFGVAALNNGNYVVISLHWDNGTATDAGAATWGSGTAGVAGVVSDANSLVGSTANDQVGYGGFTALNNGNYVVSSGDWDNGGVIDVGAVTLGDGTTGVSGAVSAANSLVGSTAGDAVGYGGFTALNNGNFVVMTPLWDNGAVTDAGSVTLGNGTLGTIGAVTVTNSVLGTVAGGGVSMIFASDDLKNRLLVGYGADNRVSLFVAPDRVRTSDPEPNVASWNGTNAQFGTYGSLLPTSVTPTNVLVYSRERGYRAAASVSVGPANQVVWVPATNYLAGERMRLTALPSIQDAHGFPIQPFAAEFTVAVAPQGGSFDGTNTLGTNSAVNVVRMAVVDWNADGALDVLVAPGLSVFSAIRIWTNNGTGGLTGPMNLSEVSGTSFQVGDLNHDGRLDLFVTRGLPGEGRPDSAFIQTGTQRVEQVVGGEEYPSSAVALGDLDLDGDLDAVVVGKTDNPTTQYRVYLNDGNGAFVPFVDQVASVQADPVDVKLGDLNGDGSLDAVIYHNDSKPGVVWLNDGTGRFAPRSQGGAWNGYMAGKRCQLGDLNGDGKLDVVVVDGNTTTVRAWINDGQATFTGVPQTLSRNVAEVEVADVNGDGVLDLATTPPGGNVVSLWTNNGAATFALLRDLTNSAGGATPTLSVGDVDGNGHLDLVVAHKGSSPQVRVWLNIAPPPVPAALVLTAQTGSIQADWTASLGATGYQVQSAVGGPNFSSPPILTSGTQFSRGSLSVGDLVYVRVQAENESGFSDWVTNSIVIPGPSTAQGVPQAWLSQYYPGTTDFEGAATNDTDQDGRQAWEEYFADTSPTNAASYFPPIALTNAPLGAISAVIDPTSTARIYEVQWTTNLMTVPPLWELCGIGMTGTGSRLLFAVGTNAEPTGFFRSRVRLP